MTATPASDMTPFRYSDPARLLEILRARERRGTTVDVRTFYGHWPERDGSAGPGVLSQWWQGHPFAVGDTTFATAEHYMMWAKARLSGDRRMMDAILAARHPREVKALGRRVQGFREKAWSEARYSIVCTANAAKFGQHPALAEYLLGTGRSVLAEASPSDAIWGIGLSADDPGVRTPSRWPGLNLLGFALCDVRRHLAGRTPGFTDGVRRRSLCWRLILWGDECQALPKCAPPFSPGFGSTRTWTRATFTGRSR
jgi:ribA/ribD-fused uncharacterized protein